MAKKLEATSAGIHAEVLRSLIRKCDTIKSEMDGSRGELGAAIKDAENTHGVHRKAFKLALVLSRQEEAARADFLRAFRDYCDKLGFADQTDLFDDARAAETNAAEPAIETKSELKSNTKSKKSSKASKATVDSSADDPASVINQGGEPDPAETRRITEQEIADEEALSRQVAH